jgi:hypothetical protein
MTISRSTYITMHLLQWPDGTYEVTVGQSGAEGEHSDRLRTGYSTASSCFEEVASLMDTMLYSWLMMGGVDPIPAVIG